jgi:peptidoglycan/xylan/chitin deacetylase (PgdA/CDA1 family)
MELIPAKIPRIVKRLFPNYIWRMPQEEKVIYLTFDDGPTPTITNWTLDVLKQFNAKATFFCIGDNVKNHPDIFDNILSNGHAIGNHTYNHPRGWNSSTKSYINNVKQAQEIIDVQLQKSGSSKIQSSNQKLFRPPYGQLTTKQGRELIDLGYQIIMWHVLAIDWKSSIKKETCLNNVINNAESGSVIVFHDSEKASKNMMHALPKTLEYFKNKGFTFKSLPA